MTLKEQLLKLKESGKGATERPWTARVDSKEAWVTDSDGTSRRHATYLYPTGVLHIYQGKKLCRPAIDAPQACRDADFTATAANSFDTLIDLAIGLAEALEAADFVTIGSKYSNDAGWVRVNVNGIVAKALSEAAAKVGGMKRKNK